MEREGERSDRCGSGALETCLLMNVYSYKKVQKTEESNRMNVISEKMEKMYERVVTKSNKKFSDPISHPFRKEKQNKNFIDFFIFSH